MTNEQIQALRAKYVDRIIAEIKAKHSHYDAYAPVMTWGEFCTISTERDADKALIAEQAKRIAELEAKTITVKLPPKVDSSNVPFAAHAWNSCIDEVSKCLTAAGITLVVGE